MKAAQIDEYGGKEVLKTIENVPKPQPDADEILVEVRAAAINPFDWKVREGLTRQMAELDFPATLGGDLAGVVAELGEDVEGFEVGQAVYGQAGALSGYGSFAEYAPVKATQLSIKPDVDYKTAAALPLAAVSAYQALVDHMHLEKGQKILIHGAAGGIGSLAVQIAKHIGADVAGTAAPEDIEFVKNLGADEVIDYRSQDFTQIIKDYDAVFDTVGGETTAKSYGVLKPGGALVSMAAQADEDLAGQHDVKFTSQFTRITPERLQAVTKLVNDGAIKPSIDKIFTLDQAAEALEYQKTGHPKGKVVILIKDE